MEKSAVPLVIQRLLLKHLRLCLTKHGVRFYLIHLFVDYQQTNHSGSFGFQEHHAKHQEQRMTKTLMKMKLHYYQGLPSQIQPVHPSNSGFRGFQKRLFLNGTTLV